MRRPQGRFRYSPLQRDRQDCGQVHDQEPDAARSPRVPIFEQVRVLGSIVRRKLKGSGSGAVYVPSFRSAVHYFCIHAGGRAVLDGIEKNLRLLPEDLEASRAVLHSQGNTSSSSIWYELRYIEEHKDLRRGHKILQLAFGSGFKCNSAVWTRMR